MEGRHNFNLSQDKLRYEPEMPQQDFSYLKPIGHSIEMPRESGFHQNTRHDTASAVAYQPAGFPPWPSPKTEVIRSDLSFGDELTSHSLGRDSVSPAAHHPVEIPPLPPPKTKVGTPDVIRDQNTSCPGNFSEPVKNSCIVALPWQNDYSQQLETQLPSKLQQFFQNARDPELEQMLDDIDNIVTCADQTPSFAPATTNDIDSIVKSSNQKPSTAAGTTRRAAARRTQRDPTGLLRPERQAGRAGQHPHTARAG